MKLYSGVYIYIYVGLTSKRNLATMRRDRAFFFFFFFFFFFGGGGGEVMRGNEIIGSVHVSLSWIAQYVLAR